VTWTAAEGQNNRFPGKSAVAPEWLGAPIALNKSGGKSSERPSSESNTRFVTQVTQCTTAECYDTGMVHTIFYRLTLVVGGLLGASAPMHAADSHTMAMATTSMTSEVVTSESAMSTARPASITIASRCEGNRQIAAKIYGDSIVVQDSEGGENRSHVQVLSGKRRQSADSLFLLLKGLGGALVLRCPNVEAVSCQFEAALDRNRLECTNCAACSDDLDRMSLATLHRFKALLRELNLFL
jgi:hypothetical protein